MNIKPYISTSFDPDANLARIVSQTARASPDAVALVANGPLTYAEVENRVLTYARGLSRLQFAPESTIGVLVPRDQELVPLLLAVLWSGAAYVPIDPAEPAPRAIRMLSLAGCAAVICDESNYRSLKEAAGAAPLPENITLSSLRARADGITVPTCAPGGQKLAYILFTSGSTGEPKGVEVEHRHLVNLLFAARTFLKFGKTDRFLATATVAFDIAAVEFFLPLISGGSLLLRDRSLLLDKAKLSAELRKHGVTTVQLGPAAWSIAMAGSSALPRVRTAITTGEPILPDFARRLAAAAADEVWNVYGPTETTVWATAHRLLADADFGPSKMSAPIGSALAGYTMLVADEHGNPVPLGQEGELWIGGAGVARGYRNQPELTASRFVTLHDGRRYYRTGDLVQQGPDGVLHYFGRNDDQIKIRGVRVEPREIETALLSVPEIGQAAATWYDRPDGNRSIIAAVVWQGGKGLNLENLRAKVEELLPAAMVPSRFVIVDRLPLTTSGKVDRKAIRAASAVPEVPVALVKMRSLALSDTEAYLGMIWAHILGIEGVRADDDFFERGGDSLSAVAMVLEMEKAFDVKISAQSVWETPRLRDLAALIDEARFKPDELGNTSIVHPMLKTGDDRIVFLSGMGFKPTDNYARQLGCSIYGLSQWAHGVGFVKAETITDLARAQIAEIRRVQPEGPYRLGGYSLGGLIVLEIAQQLREAGSEVELLFLLDPMMPPYYQLASNVSAECAPAFVPTSTSVILRTYMHAILRDPRKGLREFWSRVLVRNQLWQWLSYRLVDRHGRKPNAVTRWLLPKHRWPAFWYAARRVANTYVARPYDGRCVAVFHTKDDRWKVWSVLATGSTEFRHVDSTHLGMFLEPALSAWMQVLASALGPPANEAGI